MPLSERLSYRRIPTEDFNSPYYDRSVSAPKRYFLYRIQLLLYMYKWPYLPSAKRECAVRYKIDSNFESERERRRRVPASRGSGVGGVPGEGLNGVPVQGDAATSAASAVEGSSTHLGGTTVIRMWVGRIHSSSLGRGKGGDVRSREGRYITIPYDIT